MRVLIPKKAESFLCSLGKTDKEAFFSICYFIKKYLNVADTNPTKFANAKKVERVNDNIYQWNLRNYKIFGIVDEKENTIKLIYFIKMTPKELQEKYWKIIDTIKQEN